MADNVDLQAEERNERGKNAARRLRASGKTPAVLYGEGNEAGGSTALAVPTRIGDNALYNIAIDGDTSTARDVDAQRDPVSGLLVHVDFIPVNMTELIEVTVPLHVTGDAPGVEEGGVLQQVAYEIQVESLPGDIPQEITLDVSGLGMNENLTLGELTLPEGVTLLSEPEDVAVTVTAPTEISEEEMEAAGIVEEPTDEEEAAAEGEEAAEGEGAPEEDAAEEGEGPAGQNVQA